MKVQVEAGVWKGADLHFCLRHSPERTMLAMATVALSSLLSNLVQVVLHPPGCRRGRCAQRYCLGGHRESCGLSSTNMWITMGAGSVDADLEALPVARLSGEPTACFSL